MPVTRTAATTATLRASRRPWFNVNDMSRADLRAIYRYVRHLGPAGKPQPYVQFPVQFPE
jgi:hypothetical protein